MRRCHCWRLIVNYFSLGKEMCPEPDIDFTVLLPLSADFDVSVLGVVSVLCRRFTTGARAFIGVCTKCQNPGLQRAVLPGKGPG